MKKIGLLAIVVLSFLLVSAIAQDVASDFTLTDIDGVEFSLSDYRGKVVILDFFATWCGPCKDEIKHLNSTHKEFSADLIIISISVSPDSDTVENLKKFREEKGFFPDLWVPAGEALNYAVMAVRRGTIATSQSYQEEIMEAEFIPEELTMRERTSELLPIIFAAFYGIILVYFNRERRMFFLISGIIGVPLGVFLLSREPTLGYVCILLGLEYLVITLYKWRKAKKGS